MPEIYSLSNYLNILYFCHTCCILNYFFGVYHQQITKINGNPSYHNITLMLISIIISYFMCVVNILCTENCYFEFQTTITYRYLPTVLFDRHYIIWKLWTLESGWYYKRFANRNNIRKSMQKFINIQCFIDYNHSRYYLYLWWS